MLIAESVNVIFLLAAIVLFLTSATQQAVFYAVAAIFAPGAFMFIRWKQGIPL